MRKLKRKLKFDNISAIFGSLLVLGGIGLGLYVGIWVMFIGGIIQVIEAIRATDLSASNIAIGIAKVLFSGVVGQFSALIPMTIGSVLIGE